MSSTEKPGFFSKLFGRSVSRPATSASGPSSSNGGSISSLDELSNTNGSSPAATKPLRYLSPTAIESSFSRVPTRTVESISDTARKRPLESPQATCGVANGSFYISDTAKRFRGTAANTSLISEPGTRLQLQLPKLDTTWSAGMGAISPTNLSYSPCSSVRSLRSRITRPSSRSSVLSSKTAALLGQIEKVSTPALDARRMPMLRVGLNKERWNSLGSSTTSNPPLNRLSSVPSRYQVMSSFLTPMQKKPYWRDVARERCEGVSEIASVPSEPTSSVSVIMRAGNGETNGVKEQSMRPTTHQSVLKGPDGLNVRRDRNTFSANAISPDDTADLEALSNVRGLDESQFVFAPPTKGFLAKDVKPSFSFKKPVKINEKMEESESSEECESDEEETSGSNSGSGDDEECETAQEKSSNATTKTTENTSDTSSSAENTSKETSNEENKKISPPRTATNPISTFVPKPECEKSAWSTASESLPPPISSPPSNWDCPSCCVSNKIENVKCVCCGEANPTSVVSPSSSSSSNVNWDCPSCCVNNKSVDTKCICCGESKPGAAPPPASSSNVFGANAFKPTNTSSTFSFGFQTGSGNLTTPSFGIKTSTEGGVVKPTTSSIAFGLKSPEPSIPLTTPAITVTQTISDPCAPSNPPTTTSMSGDSVNSSTASSFSFGLKVPTNGDNAKSVTPTSTLALFPPASSVPTSSTASAAPLFGSASGISTNTMSSIASTPIFNSSISAPSSSLFGAPPSAPTKPLFGSSALSSISHAVPTSSIPLFGTSSTATPSIPTFGSTASPALAPNGSGLTLSSLPFNFGQSGAAKAPIFGSSEKPPFGVSTEKPLFGAATEKPPLFGGSKPVDDEGPGAKKAMFQSSFSSTPFSFGGQNNSSGTANLFGSSSAGGSSTLVSGLTPSASAPSFSLPTAPPSTFNFGSQCASTAAAPVPAPPMTFNFGGPSASTPASTPFVFGSQSAPAAAPFGMGSFGSVPSATVPASFAPPDASNPFAFNSSAPSGSRKMIQAKRRLPGKR